MPGNKDKERRARADIKLFRSLSIHLTAALGVEVSIAVGLFTLLGPLNDLAGSSAPAAFLLIAIAILPTVLSYAELSARTPGPGGSYRLVAPALPGLGAFLTGWSALLGQIGVGALLRQATASFLVDALKAFFPAFTFPPQLLTIPVALLITIVNLRGVRISRRLQGSLVACVVGLLLILTAASIVRGWP
jgi:amino acid transporter